MGQLLQLQLKIRSPQTLPIGQFPTALMDGHVITQRASQYNGVFVHLRAGLIILEPFGVLLRQWEFGFPTVRVREV